MTETTRRAVLASAAGVGAAAALAACGGGDDAATPGTGAGTNGAATDGAATPGATTGAGTTGTGTTGTGTTGLVRKADIPVGGGKIFAGEDLVITQPVAGTFKGFSAACTHQGCNVSSVANGVIHCVCHGSGFSIADGSVKDGPATLPLPAKDLKIDGDAISLA